jgi:hypothetical protein
MAVDVNEGAGRCVRDRLTVVASNNSTADHPPNSPSLPKDKNGLLFHRRGWVGNIVPLMRVRHGEATRVADQPGPTCWPARLGPALPKRLSLTLVGCRCFSTFHGLEGATAGWFLAVDPGDKADGRTT